MAFAIMVQGTLINIQACMHKDKTCTMTKGGAMPRPTGPTVPGGDHGRQHRNTLPDLEVIVVVGNTAPRTPLLRLVCDSYRVADWFGDSDMGRFLIRV